MSGATPKVRGIARDLGVDLTKVRGTGAGGRITPSDVRDAAAGGGSRPRAAAGRSRPTLVLEFQSRWSRRTSAGSGFLVERASVKVDVFGPNPLVDELRQADPETYAEASKRGPAPTLFTTGDLPLFTASGIDPALLNQLPWVARHAAAKAPAAEATAIFEEYAAADQSTWARAQSVLEAGAMAYHARVDAWANPDGQRSAFRRL